MNKYNTQNCHVCFSKLLHGKFELKNEINCNIVFCCDACKNKISTYACEFVCVCDYIYVCVCN